MAFRFNTEGDIKLIVRIVILFCISTLINDFTLPEFIDNLFKKNKIFQFIVIFLFSTGYMITTPTHHFTTRDLISAFVASLIIILLTSPRKVSNKDQL